MPQTEAQRQAALTDAGLTAGQQQAVVAGQPTVPSPIQQPAPAPVAPGTPITPQQPSSAVAVGIGTPQTPSQTPQNAPGGAQPALAIPPTGSVVDLLNMAGQDSSYAARQQLAQQYGIQNYSGTAAQNQELSKKYLDAYNQLKGTAVPESPAEARNAFANFQEETAQAAEGTPTQQFMDMYASMNPIEANLFQQLSTLASTQTNQQTLKELYAQEVTAQGIPALNMELADINRIMEGTEDDIRDEITNAGGFATDSQVQALVGARNKNLIKQANYLTNVLAAKNDYIDRIVSLTQADREQVSKDLDRKLGITETLISMSRRMEDSARENYKMIVDSVGWEGLAEAVAGNEEQAKKVERLFGLGKGELEALGKYKKPLTPTEELDLENRRLQNQKLRQDLSTTPSVPTQVVDVGGKKLLINSKTGQTISEIGTGKGSTDELRQALSMQNVTDIQNIVDSPYLNAAVGTSKAGRYSPLEWITGGKSAFVGEMDSLVSQLSLESLIQAKAEGATFGALSDQELRVLAAAATPLGSDAWTVKDDNGNIIGWKVSEDKVRAQLDTINRFAKLDFLLKGGSLDAAGLIETPDGTIWYENYDGSLTQVK